ncbi:MAG: hypothetical protein COB02_04725 [Candidatus Cloacimonadota bacterium]|nr:MAG: hypothetical protein COB02_04725 [Candidatus Cloacimonadota bacterium]
MKIAYKIFIIICILFNFGCDSQKTVVDKKKVELSSSVNKISSNLSDEIKFKILLNYDKSITDIKIPEIGPLIKGLRIIEPSDKKTKNANRIYLEKIYTLQSDITGTFILPKVIVDYKENNIKKTISTGRIFVEVLAEDEKSDDSLEDIEEIDFIKTIKYQRDYRGFYALFALIILIIILYFLYKKYSQETWEEQDLTAHEWVNEALIEFQSKKYLEQAMYKEFYQSLSYIYRGFLSKRFNTNALESTREELLISLNKVEELKSFTDKLQQFFKEDEMAKFADIYPKVETMKSSIFLLNAIVEKTVLLEESQEQEWEEVDE